MLTGDCHLVHRGSKHNDISILLSLQPIPLKAFSCCTCGTPQCRFEHQHSFGDHNGEQMICFHLTLFPHQPWSMSGVLQRFPLMWLVFLIIVPTDGVVTITFLISMVYLIKLPMFISKVFSNLTSQMRFMILPPLYAFSYIPFMENPQSVSAHYLTNQSRVGRSSLKFSCSQSETLCLLLFHPSASSVASLTT